MYGSRQSAQPVASGSKLREYFFCGLFGNRIGTTGGLRSKETVYPLVNAVLVLLYCFSVVCPPAYSENDPVLKPDVPKLDSSQPRPNSQSASDSVRPKVLTGKIEHAEKVGKKKKLFSSAEKESNEGKFSPQQGKAALDKRMLKSRSKQDWFDIQAQSSIGIIGVKFVMVYGSPPVINRVFPDTPASRVGLRVNDVIVAVDGIPTLGLTKEEVYGMIIGTPNTPVTLSVKRNGDYQARTMNRMDFNDITDPAVKRDYMMSM